MLVEVQERIRQIWDQNSKCFTVFTGHFTCIQDVGSRMITFFKVNAVKFKEFASFRVGKGYNGLTSRY